jgi:hypothetical protein
MGTHTRTPRFNHRVARGGYPADDRKGCGDSGHRSCRGTARRRAAASSDLARRPRHPRVMRRCTRRRSRHTASDLPVGGVARWGGNASLFVGLLLVVITAQPAAAITGGQRDEVAHQRRCRPVHHRGGQVPVLRHADLAHGGAHRGPLHRRNPGHQSVARPTRAQHRAGGARPAPRTTSPGPPTRIPVGRQAVGLQAARPGRRGARRAGRCQVAGHHAGTAAAGRHARRQPRRAQERDVHPGRPRRRLGQKKAQIVVPERRFTTSFLQDVQDEVVTFRTR